MKISKKNVILLTLIFRGYGSVGRAPRSQRGGQRFESAYLHQTKKLTHTKVCVSFFFVPKYRHKGWPMANDDAIDGIAVAIAIPSLSLLTNPLISTIKTG